MIADYGEYLRLQGGAYLSHESEVERWVEGQRRFVEASFGEVPRSARVLDCACGDGIGLEALRFLGFLDPVGVELSPAKAGRARGRGFRVEERDMHDLSLFEEGSFDAVLSSHTLEHAYEPGRALSEIHRVLAPGGTLHVVLPFPDPGHRNELAHAAKYEIGTDRLDGGEKAAAFFTERGFDLIERRLDSFREAELWLRLEKRGGGARTQPHPA